MHDGSLILLVTLGLAFALLFGAITNRLGLSPIVGYLLAGVMLGPTTPGFVGNQQMASELAEIGVVLLMFGVGLHFDPGDLWRVRSIVGPGAAATIAIALTAGTALCLALGLALPSALLMGVSISVASTVVLVRVLGDRSLLNTPDGHVAVGWLVVEDLFTVVVLVLLPALARASGAAAVARSLAMGLLNMVVLGVLVLVIGRRLVPRFMNEVARTRSRELFTLAVLVVALGIAAASARFFGVSMALGAFLAGMVVGRSDVGHQAASDALPMRDAFAVLFFVSVGMLFDPRESLEHWRLIVGLLIVILLVKPIAAYTVITRLGHPARTALTVALALGQIGEFSFILGQLGRSLGLLTAAETSELVTCAMIAITLNPLIFGRLGWIEAKLRRRAAGAQPPLPAAPVPRIERPRAVVVGYGPVGRTLTRILRDSGIEPVVIDQNVDTIRQLRRGEVHAVFGDARSPEILTAAGIEHARFLCLTLPERAARYPIIATARSLAPSIQIIARARYIGEGPELERAGVAVIAFEEAEVAVALAETLLRRLDVPADEITRRTDAVRRDLARNPIRARPGPESPGTTKPA